VTTNIIASARDEEVIIVSTEKGYKIPHDCKDCLKWTEHVKNQSIPYLQRLEKARNKLLLATNNRFDIADANIFPALSRYLNGKIRTPFANSE
jgi:SpoVK/Ycf46/Vps4 family AAA+-type ATPase